MTDFLLAVALVLMVNAFLCLYRAVRGPAIQDRIISVNIINTKTLVVLLLVFFVTGTPQLYIDIALVYALLNFVVTVALSRYLEAEGSELRRHGRKNPDNTV
ncbi:MAG: cation:proton antiporter [Actinobacteria bacterium]|nr:cation:proton antiporter [Actinomycetota bacterium]